MKRAQRLILYIGCVSGVLLLDRITKYWALSLSDDYPVSSWFHFSLVFNPGISWGLFQNASAVVTQVIVPLLGLLIIGTLGLYTFARATQGKSVFGELLVAAGAFSNWFDRLYWPGVIDFIIIHYKAWEFPAFNVADGAITVGVCIMLYVAWKEC